MQVSEGRLGLSLSKELLMSHDVLCVKYRLNLVHISCQVSVRAVRHLLIRCFLSCFDSPTKDPNKLLIAAGLLDHTIKVFFDDSLKFFLSLYGLLCFVLPITTLMLNHTVTCRYGHKLPVTSLDICSDCSLLASGSADKTVKLWGLDFGDCHRSLLGHEDTVTCVRWQPNTHLLFTGSKDGTLKYWDADR